MWMEDIPGGLGSWRTIESLIHDGYMCAGSPATMILQTQINSHYLDLSEASPRRQDLIVPSDIIVRDINHPSALKCTSENFPHPSSQAWILPFNVQRIVQPDCCSVDDSTQHWQLLNGTGKQ